MSKSLNMMEISLGSKDVVVNTYIPSCTVAYTVLEKFMGVMVAYGYHPTTIDEAIVELAYFINEREENEVKEQ